MAAATVDLEVTPSDPDRGEWEEAAVVPLGAGLSVQRRRPAGAPGATTHLRRPTTPTSIM